MKLDFNDIYDQGKPISVFTETGSFKITSKQGPEAANIRIDGKYRHIFGLGERFDVLDQAGRTVEIHVEEKFTKQGAKTYLPVPFFFTDNGLGIYVDTQRITKFTFNDIILIELPYEKDGRIPDVYIYTGTPCEIMQGMASLLGVSPLPPRWAFGPWVSANRWNNQSLVEAQMDITLDRHFPASVLVIEAWSDEATFYLWNDAEYQATTGEEPLKGNELVFPAGARWPDPAGMIARLHDNGIRLLLWQVPVLKKLEQGRLCVQHDRDMEFAEKNAYIVRNIDGTPYVIPQGHWFSGSFVPDFTNPAARDWWFSKRKYLSEMGVDGYKTDGGEFIYDESVLFSDGRTGKEMINDYPRLYSDAYFENNGTDQILFSRAGYTGSRKAPIHWAGDQISTWDEMRHVLTAGLSAGLSGVLYWSFDIGGFAGPMPDPELYCRSVQWAVFAPVMQWHSEPIGGQFADLMASSEKVNDRSPWNIAAYYDKPELIDQLQFHFALRMNLLPSIYSFAINSAKTGLPMMRPLMLEFPRDTYAYEVDDEYIFGNLLIAPVLLKTANKRSVYLPDGTWINLWTGETATGPAVVDSACGQERIPVFIKSGKALLIDLDETCAPGIWEKNGRADIPSNEKSLYMALGGTAGKDMLCLDSDRMIYILWDEAQITVQVKDGSGKNLKSRSITRKTLVPVTQDSFGISIYSIPPLE